MKYNFKDYYNNISFLIKNIIAVQIVYLWSFKTSSSFAIWYLKWIWAWPTALNSFSFDKMIKITILTFTSVLLQIVYTETDLIPLRFHNEE